jgi:hypothetical protein
MMEVMKNAYESLVGKSEVKKNLREPRRRWEDDTKMYNK